MLENTLNDHAEIPISNHGNEVFIHSARGLLDGKMEKRPQRRRSGVYWPVAGKIKMEILVYISYTEVGASAPVLDNQGG
jgi:hypothetical protein